MKTLELDDILEQKPQIRAGLNNTGFLTIQIPYTSVIFKVEFVRDSLGKIIYLNRWKSSNWVKSKTMDNSKEVLIAEEWELIDFKNHKYKERNKFYYRERDYMEFIDALCDVKLNGGNLDKMNPSDKDWMIRQIKYMFGQDYLTLSGKL